MGPASDHSDNAFDFLRLAAAFAVLYSHSYALFGLPLPSPATAQSYGSLGVYVFFALSGFLVCSSWDKDPDLKRFWVRRALRILPGLFVAVAFTTFVVGLAVTSLPWGAYLRAPDTWAYLASNATMVVGRFGLPGVFEHNHFANAANASLWTLRYEVLMYGVLSMLGLLARRGGFRWACLGLLALLVGVQVKLRVLEAPAPGPWTQALERLTYRFDLAFAAIGLSFDANEVLTLGVFFFAGSCLYLFRSKIRHSAWLALLLCLLPGLVADKFWVLASLWLALPYAAVVAAYKLPEMFRRTGGRDYSYGIYIYAFPVQQVCSMLLPNSGPGWLAGLVLCAGVTLLLAALSWHGIERPALRLKARLLPARPGTQLPNLSSPA